jgi:outer membrane protein assembly factor BamB
MSRLAKAACAAVFLGFILVFIAAYILVPGVAAQDTSRSTSYWEYAASSRLTATYPVDVDRDGVDEFLVLDRDNRVTLLSPEGQEQWTYSSPRQVLAAGAVDTQRSGATYRDLALAGANELTLLDHEGTELWQVPINASTSPVVVRAYDYQDDGHEEILLLLASGQIFVYNDSGSLIWQFAGQEDLATNVDPKILVDDYDGDGAQEIVLGLFTPRRFSQLLFIDDDESVLWRQSISRRISALVGAPYENDRSYIAVGTNFGQIDLYTPAGELVWFRTVNKAITTLALANSSADPVLLAGTEAGSVFAFNKEGRRLWTNHLANDANRRVLSLLAADNPVSGIQETRKTETNNQRNILLAVVLESASDNSDLAEILIMADQGQILTKAGDTDLPHLAGLVDINQDNIYELLFGRFATLQLFGLGVGNSEYIQEWEYQLDAAPTAMLVLDLDGDRGEEIVVGTENGQIHALSSDRGIRWLHAPGDAVTSLTAINGNNNQGHSILVIRQPRAQTIDVNNQLSATSRLELRHASGEPLWAALIPGSITSLSIDDQADPGKPAIFIATTDKLIFAFDLLGNQIWQHSLAKVKSDIEHILVENNRANEPDRLLIAAGEEIYTLNLEDNDLSSGLYASFSAPIEALYEVQQDGKELSVDVVVLTGDGLMHGLNRRGVEMAHLSWPFRLAGLPGVSIAWNERSAEVFREDIPAFLVASDQGQIEQIAIRDNRPVSLWRIEGLGNVQTISWEDLRQDGQPDSGLAGRQDGRVLLFDQLQTRTPQQVFEIALDSDVFGLSFLSRSARQSPDILTITQNGLVRLYREEENRPPLLTHPRAEAEQGSLSFSVSVNDVENDPVSVRLELWDATTESWQQYPDQQIDNGNGQLFWPVVDLPRGSDRIRYRFGFNDGLYQGFMTPPLGPSIPPDPTVAGFSTWLIGPLGLIFLAGLVLFVRQQQTPGAQAGRFYRHLRQNPDETLILLESRYAESKGSPDFLLQLANQARRASDSDVANLSDGLFLLANRPQAGLSIITRTLDEMPSSNDNEADLDHRRHLYKTAQALLEAPSITELSLLRPQLVQLVATVEHQADRSPILDNLLPVLSNVRDSERVGSISDRLVYLNQAAVRVRQVHDQLDSYSPSVERTLARAITRRWSGLLSAEIEELRGRAELEVTLKTKRLAPSQETVVAMDIRNIGRAPAENILAVLEDNPAYQVSSDPQLIPFLPPGRSRQIQFLIEPHVEDRFRVVLSLTYDDQNRREKNAAFADMVNLLPPVREFSPIANPYLPGTPLRKESPLFYGREELFEFITENSGLQNQRNVLMLVGQRRTGKTSVLLRLDDHLPEKLLPVYIDCQSLGVSPGIAPLLQEFAWYIADALNARGISCLVPEASVWENDPGRVFQREFLPSIRNLLPAGSILLLIFDEFEAFESIVADGILPPTVFPYLRHLMQHSEWLSFIFVGTQRLEEMSADYWSVLFNTALYRKIDYLSEADATRLINEPVSPAIIYDDLAIDKILRVTAGHPYFLQLVCYTLVKRANQYRSGYITISDVNAALDEMLRLGEVHFAYLWQRSSFAERAILSAAAHVMDRSEPFHPATLIEYLQSFSIELDPTDATAALNRLVQRDILREETEDGFALYSLRIGLVGLWVRQNKSLSRLLAQVET